MEFCSENPTDFARIEWCLRGHNHTNDDDKQHDEWQFVYAVCTFHFAI